MRCVSTARAVARVIVLGAVILGLTSSTVGCFRSQYTLGDGPRGGEVRVHRTWYGIWGFVPLNGVDGGDLVGPGEHLRVTNWFGFSDAMFNIFLGPLGFFRKSTLIEK